MKRGVTAPTLEHYWAQLEPCLKRFAPDERRLALALYRELAKGQPVEVRQFAAASGIADGQARALLARAPLKALTYYDEAGRVVGYGGLSVKPMHHRFEVDGRALSTWCAWDSLFIPEILGEPASIISPDPETGEPVHLGVTPKGIETVEPGDAVISFVSPDPDFFGTSAENVMRSFCHYIFFFGSRSSGERWVARHRGTFLYSLGEAFALAKWMNARNFGNELGGK